MSFIKTACLVVIAVVLTATKLEVGTAPIPQLDDSIRSEYNLNGYCDNQQYPWEVDSCQAMN
jgi:hypothetical protein